MRITKLAICNYRSIRSLEMDCRAMVTLLGPNNHGKSNILSALEFALSTSSKPGADDFCIHGDDDELWVEVTFSELTEQEAKTFERYLATDGSVCIRKTCRIQDDKLEVAYNGYLEEPADEWLKAGNASQYTSRDKIAQTPLADLVPRNGRITKDIVQQAQSAYIDANRASLTFSRTLETGPLLGQKTVAGGLLPDLFLIPAVKDLTDEIKVKTTTTFGRLLGRAIKDMAETDPRMGAIQQKMVDLAAALNDRSPTDDGAEHQLALLEQRIEGELSGWGVRVGIEVTPPEIERLFESGTSLHVDDGTRTTAERKGHGLQRAMIFALLRAWAAGLRAQAAEDEAVAPRRRSTSVIFAVEEPELFLHPHAQRRLAQSLREIAGTADHQVFLCTHSSHFVDLARYQEVVIASKYDDAGTTVRQCTVELFAGPDLAERKKRFQMAQWINPDRAEMFFARRVVFVEGETEQVLIPFLADKLGRLDPEVSVIDCGSKHNLPLYIAIAEAFQIPHVVVHDEDPLPDPIPHDWPDDKRKAKQRTFEINATIADAVKAPMGRVCVLGPDLEKAAGVSKSQGDKKGKSLAALDHFEGVDMSELPQCMVEVVEHVYGRWTDE